MAIYAVNNQMGGTEQSLTTTYKTLVAVTASSTTAVRRGKGNMIAVGTDGTAANNSMVYDLSRQTAAGTSTSVTPVPIDPAEVACLAVGSANFSAEGTITSNSSVFNVAINQQLSYVWQAVPDRGELIFPATNLAGFALRAKSAAYTSTATGHLQFIE